MVWSWIGGSGGLRNDIRSCFIFLLALVCVPVHNHTTVSSSIDSKGINLDFRHHNIPTVSSYEKYGDSGIVPILVPGYCGIIPKRKSRDLSLENQLN